MKDVLQGRVIQPGVAEGLALVSSDQFPLSGVTFDLSTGRIAWPGHPLDGQSVKGRILVLPSLTAFAGGDWALLALCTHYQTGPSAILCSELPPMLVAGAVLGKLVTVAQLPATFLSSIRQGDSVKVDTVGNQLTVRHSDTYRLQPMASATLRLTDEENRIVDGEQGAALQECLKALIAYGEALNAERLVPVDYVHAAGSGYNTTGEAAVSFLQRLASRGLKAAVPATLNPIAVDLERWHSVLGLPEELLRRQEQLNSAFGELGFIGTYSCKPYWTPYAPATGTNFVSSEHNVVSYANSVIGARTNFESNIMAILAALTGRIPYYGLYIDENRLPTLKVAVRAQLKDAVDWRCLGVAAARKAKGRIPYFVIPAAQPDQRNLRDLCAAFGPPWTSVGLIHVEGTTPGFERAKQAAHASEEIQIGSSDLQAVRDEFFAPTNEPIDLVAVGCPQASIDDIADLIDRMRGRRVSPTSRLWIWTDAQTRAEAEKRGYAAELENAGGEIVSDTCGCAACPISRSDLGIRHVATDSTKSLGFLQRTGLICHLGSLDECVAAATTGRLQRLSN